MTKEEIKRFKIGKIVRIDINKSLQKNIIRRNMMIVYILNRNMSHRDFSNIGSLDKRDNIKDKAKRKVKIALADKKWDT